VTQERYFTDDVKVLDERRWRAREMREYGGRGGKVIHGP